MSDLYDAFPGLTIDRPADGVLRITIEAPGLNAVTPAVDREQADIWLTVDRDPDARRRMALRRCTRRGTRPSSRRGSSTKRGCCSKPSAI